MKSRKSNLPMSNKILKGINFRQISRHMSTSFFPNWKRILVFIVWKRLFNNRGKNYFENTSNPEVFFKALDFDDKVEEMISNQRKCNEISGISPANRRMCFPQGWTTWKEPPHFYYLRHENNHIIPSPIPLDWLVDILSSYYGS